MQALHARALPPTSSTNSRAGLACSMTVMHRDRHDVRARKQRFIDVCCTEGRGRRLHNDPQKTTDLRTARSLCCQCCCVERRPGYYCALQQEIVELRGRVAAWLNKRDPRIGL